MEFNALTYNLHKGKSYLTRRSVVSELKSAFRDLDIDIVFLQEVVGLNAGESHLDHLADSLGFHRAYGLNNSNGRGHYGNAILSRFPIESSANRNISTSRFERRGSLQARVPLAGREVMLYCLHLDLLESGRSMQIQNVVHQVKHQLSSKGPVLLAGDFNDWRGRVCRRLERELGLKNAFFEKDFEKRDRRTFPSFFPSVSLDRFYFKNLELQDVRVLRGNPWSRLSDHCPVFSHFSLYPEDI